MVGIVGLTVDGGCRTVSFDAFDLIASGASLEMSGELNYCDTRWPAGELQAVLLDRAVGDFSFELLFDPVGTADAVVYDLGSLERLAVCDVDLPTGRAVCE